MKTVLGYTDKMVVAPGESIDVKVSVEDDSPTFDVSLLRLYCTDDDPRGPGIEAEPVDSVPTMTCPARCQPISIGSNVVVPLPANLAIEGSFCLRVDLWPTLPQKGRQAILGSWREDLSAGVLLEIDETGCASLRLGTDSVDAIVVSTGRQMLARRWYTVWARFDHERGKAWVGQWSHEPLIDRSDHGTVSKTVPHGARPSIAGEIIMEGWGRPLRRSLQR